MAPPVPSHASNQVAEFLANKGVPRRVIDLFRAANEAQDASAEPMPEGGILLGYSGEDEDEELIYRHPDTGAVYFLPLWREKKPEMVNSSIQAFVATLELIARKYPPRQLTPSPKPGPS